MVLNKTDEKELIKLLYSADKTQLFAFKNMIEDKLMVLDQLGK